MRAVTVSRFGGPEAIEITELPTPTPGPRKVRIRVGAAALNPVDAAIRAGVFGGEGERLGLGWDVAGTIEAVGAEVDWEVGERVMGLATGHREPLGTHADYVVLDADAIAPSPVSLDDVQAATLPLNTLSAFQSLEMLALSPGQNLLVTGAAGAVGGHVVELAHRYGLEITAMASPSDEPFLLSRGADHFLSRGANPPLASFAGVLDAAGLGRSALNAVRHGGSYVGLWPGQEPEPERGVRVGALDVQANGAQLAALSRLADQGGLVARVAQTYPLEEAAAAHARLAEGRLRGRLVLVP